MLRTCKGKAHPLPQQRLAVPSVITLARAASSELLSLKPTRSPCQMQSGQPSTLPAMDLLSVAVPRATSSQDDTAVGKTLQHQSLTVVPSKGCKGLHLGRPRDKGASCNSRPAMSPPPNCILSKRGTVPGSTMPHLPNVRALQASRRTTTFHPLAASQPPGGQAVAGTKATLHQAVEPRDQDNLCISSKFAVETSSLR